MEQVDFLTTFHFEIIHAFHLNVLRTNCPYYEHFSTGSVEINEQIVGLNKGSLAVESENSHDGCIILLNQSFPAY